MLEDYDLCAPCIKAGSAERHNPFHEFFEIEEPGRVVVHTVFSGNGEMDSSGTPRRTDSTAARDVPNPVLPSAEPVTHNAFCDLCDSNIRGTRYKCLDCMGTNRISVCILQYFANMFWPSRFRHLFCLLQLGARTTSLPWIRPDPQCRRSYSKFTTEVEII